MLGAAAGLLVEGRRPWCGRAHCSAPSRVSLFVVVAQRVVDHRDALELGGLHGADARKAVLIVGVMTVHSVAEGVGVGASFGGGAAFGLVIAIAIAVHNIPEGFAISLVLVPRGASVRSAAAWSIFSSLPQPLMAVPAFLFVEQFAQLLPAGLGFAAGAMVWMAAADLLPDALRHTSRRSVAARHRGGLRGNARPSALARLTHSRRRPIRGSASTADGAAASQTARRWSHTAVTRRRPCDEERS